MRKRIAWWDALKDRIREGKKREGNGDKKS
jgi:hypothetical protein